MQYVWQHRLWIQQDMRTVDGLRVQVIDPGILNRGSGPDFFNAKIRIDGKLWAGDVEIHVRASDWHRHGHDKDAAYDSVVLHVVDKDDTIIRRGNGEVIAQMRMPCSADLRERYGNIVGRSDVDLPCCEAIREMEEVYLTDWLGSLGYERLYRKVDRVMGYVERLGNDWEGACYVAVARALGFGINGDAMERLAMSVPLGFIGKHSDSLVSVEALLFGQSGLLPMSGVDGYADALHREYDFMVRKFGLRGLNGSIWKMGMRPQNFPHRRIATLAAMLHGGFKMMGRILDIGDEDDAVGMFNPQLTGYWERRYRWGAESERTNGRLSRGAARGLMVNAVVPLMYAYGLNRGDEEMMNRAIRLLEELPAERNSVTELFVRAGIKARDAFATQGLIELRREYCELHKCLYCRIGHRLLAADARRRK